MRDGTDDASPSLTGAARADGLFGDDVVGASLAAWAAEATVDEAAAARARRHWLTVQAESESSVAGVLLDLGERERTVVLGVDATQIRGRIVGVGADFVVIERPDGAAVIVTMDAVGTVRSIEDTPVWGDRGVRLDTTLSGILGPIASDRPSVVVHATAGTVHGVLRSAGTDVLRLQTDAGPAWVPVAALHMLVLP